MKGLKGELGASLAQLKRRLPCSHLHQASSPAPLAAIQMSQPCTLSNKALVADVLHSCFGKGDFKVVVEEVCEDGSVDGAQTKRTEFEVWSVLLMKWSDVFANMITHGEFIEGSKGEVVVKDFSSTAVEAFLRFLYSGTLLASLPTLIEVGVIADKYQVQPLYASCLGTVRDRLTSYTACEIFECADRFHLEDRSHDSVCVHSVYLSQRFLPARFSPLKDLRRKAKEEILIEPREALPRRTSLSDLAVGW